MTKRTFVMTARTIAAFIALASVPSTRAQISGVIADSVAGRRVPGAVVIVYDSSQRVISRALADESGRFRIDVAAGTTRLRFVKIGYRPVERRVTSPTTMRVMMERLPSLLAPVTTSDQPRCPRNATRPAAFGLWEQAKAALLETVLARETNTAEVSRISYRRYMIGRGDEIERQSVRRDSGTALRSFDAAHGASEFATRGFAENERGGLVRFYGPDAEVLLDDALVDAYCLEIASRRNGEPNQVGLRFRPMSRRSGRVDLDGVVWIDTVARALKDIEYIYLGLERWAEPMRPGGKISFNEVASGVVWIDRWNIRMTGARVDMGGTISVPFFSSARRVIEGGAELASARWPDGRVWRASLGTVEIKLPAGTRAWLDSTDYAGVADSTGTLRFTDVLPGPYSIAVYDSTLAVVDTAIPAKPALRVKRDSVSRVTATVPTVAQFVAQGCIDQDSYERASFMLVTRILSADSMPRVWGVWQLDNRNKPAAPVRVAEGSLGGDGMLFVCRRLTGGDRLVLRVWGPRANPDKDPPAAEVPITISQPITALKVVLPL